ncbi:hypothetical protein KSP39_PZI020255 [Platanthera zijinensis]|uniref:Uncharacterized protein n=1 Tax=Platanthera zijinensis TaxID=2320716 RepID=A0AAP0B146_9ASPA
MSVRVEGFERVRHDYPECPDFGDIYYALSNDPPELHEGFITSDGYLFYGSRLCVPQTSLREFLIWELHAGGAARHFGRDKRIFPKENKTAYPQLAPRPESKRSSCRIVGTPWRTGGYREYSEHATKTCFQSRPSLASKTPVESGIPADKHPIRAASLENTTELYTYSGRQVCPHRPPPPDWADRHLQTARSARSDRAVCPVRPPLLFK